MAEVVVAAFFDDEHARQMLLAVRAAGVANARLAPVADVPADRLPEWVDLDRPAYGSGERVRSLLLVPAGEERRAEVAQHRHLGLCRWCGRRLGRGAAGVCPDCGTPVDQ
jgi:hypothetical protein